MSAPKIVIVVLWVAFWIYWAASAREAKAGTADARKIAIGIAIAVAVILLAAVVDTSGLEVHDPVLEAIGTAFVAAGVGFAVWARVNLGRNWGMPMTRKEEPELITSGPYRLVRHPIYTGILAALVGTGLGIDLLVLAVAAISAAYFFFSATVEERNLAAAFPVAYPRYRARTKMLIPFVL